MSDGDVVSHDARKGVSEMNDGVVLNISMVADDDAVDVAAKHGVIPNAGMIAEGDVAEDGCAASDEDAFAEFGLLAEEAVELFLQFSHGGRLPVPVLNENKKWERSRLGCCSVRLAPNTSVLLCQGGGCRFKR